MASPLFAIIKREYFERVRTKAFWISTALVPVLMAALFLLPLALMRRAGGEYNLAVVDAAALHDDFAQRLEERRPDSIQVGKYEWKLERVPAPAAGGEAALKARLRERVRTGELHAYLFIGANAVEDEEEIEFVAKNVSNMLAIDKIETALNRAVIARRLVGHKVPEGEIDRVLARVRLDPIAVDDTKGKSNAIGAYLTVVFLFMVQYVTVIMYGIAVMRGVLEEKTSRVIEVVLSSVKPFPLMLGKILGIGAVGLTQYGVWILFAAGLSLSGIGAASGSASPALNITGVQMAYFALFFLLAYFLYAALYAAVGAAFDTEQDAQQFVGAISIFLVIPAILMGYVLNDPSSTVSVALSLFPMFTPLLMYLRLLVQPPPVWQVLLGVGLVIASIGGMTWIAAKIYRVGILMYGKKPTIPEVFRWIRHS